MQHIILQLKYIFKFQCTIKVWNTLEKNPVKNHLGANVHYPILVSIFVELTNNVNISK